MKNKLRKCLSNPEFSTQIADILKTDPQLSLPKKFNLMKEYHNNLMIVNAYDKESERLINKVKEDTYETNRFIKLYNKLNSITKRDAIINSPKVSPFNDILNEYHKRKIKVPFVTERKNIFKLSPLILPNQKLNEYYKYHHKKQIVSPKKLLSDIIKENESPEKNEQQMSIKNKNLEYLEKLNNCFKKQVLQSNRNQIKTVPKKSNSMADMTSQTPRKKRLFNFKDSIVTPRKTIKNNLRLTNENKTLYNYNKKVEKMIINNITDFSKRKERNSNNIFNYSPTSFNSETISTHYNTKDFKKEFISQKKYEFDLIKQLTNFVESKRKYSLRNSFSKKDLEGTYNKVKKLNLDSFSRNPLPETITTLPFGGETITRDLTELKKKVQFFEYLNVPKLKQSYINLQGYPNLDKIDSLKQVDSKIVNLEQLYTEKLSQI